MKTPYSTLNLLITATFALSTLTSSRAQASESLEVQLRRLFSVAAYTQPKEIPYREENPYSVEKAELGRTLFFDQRLSKGGNQSCVSCHQPNLGWEMGIPKALGAQEMPRKSQTLLNLAWNDTWFWDGRADGYEQQFHMALTSPKALALTANEAEQRLRAVAGYRELFEKAFGPAKEPAKDPAVEVITEKRIALALEIYQRGLISGPATFDRWLAGDKNAMNESAKRGALVFAGRGNCIACHSGWNFSDNGFHDLGLGDADMGRGKMVAIEAVQHAFKTPTLRSINERRPYMHDGSRATLQDVVEAYDKGPILQRPSLAPEMHALHLSSQEKSDLVEFLKTLSGDDAPVTFPRMPM